MAPRRTRATERDRSRRVLSQNFLADPAAVARVVAAARPGPGDLLLEVGAGRGRLTRALAARSGRLVAYEIDPVAAADLAGTCAELPRRRPGRPWPGYASGLAGSVPRAAFRPVPRVDAGILRRDRRAEPLLPPGEWPAYRRLVEVGFGGVGGGVAASLSRHRPRARVDAALRAVRLDRDALPGEVWPEQWITLHRLLR
ncbi:rRNA adenine N-6-methyltransferase family protein [Micromonospora sp. DH15]|nr:rRNA adenine N-6-methyltransferase family protein [Micromonospora sp. DH15]